MHAARGVGVAEDKDGPPLPRRVPGAKRGAGTGPLTRPVLSQSDLQRIRAALDSAQTQAQAPAPAAERPAPLPRRTRRARNGNQPPVPVGRLELPAALLPSPPKEAPAESPPAVPAPRPGVVTGETERQPEVTAQPRPAIGTPTGRSVVPAQRAPAEEREERQDQPDDEKASPEQERASREPETASGKEAPGDQKNGHARPGEGAVPWDDGADPPPAPGTASDAATPGQASAP